MKRKIKKKNKKNIIKNNNKLYFILSSIIVLLLIFILSNNIKNDNNVISNNNLDNTIEQEKQNDINNIIIENINETIIKDDNINENKAKLAIIIDDISLAKHIKAIKNTGLKIIPSLFPSDTNHPNTKEFAKKFDFFMVHLPLSAINFKNEEIKTLNINSTLEQIDERINQIKKDFPNLKFINNHTGSLFTSDEEAMRRLFKVFQKYDLIFVDSKTSAKSKVELISKEFNQTYIKRDIFLDNEDNVDYIQNQLKQAIKIAQKNGFAIAIGHPRANTFKALNESKELLKEVELIYLNEYYENP